ncbi:MAG TPA: zf-HC2 domain-containing protein [Micropepsaceae bacterium]|nr:zf-HC2 domain-containing protein [Micropepsaceae bacterium]
MACNEALRLQAYFDGELDASASADIERHMETCRDCAALVHSLEALRGGLREDALYHRASPVLRSRIAKGLDRESSGPRGFTALMATGRQFWSGAASGAVATAFAAALASLVFFPVTPNPLVNDVMSAHLRSLMENHLIDVVSTDQHTVKPWFAGHADVSPPTADFPKEDYRLVGGRVDYVEGHRAAVLVYRHGAHTINVFSWARSGESLPNIVDRNGYHAVFWQSGDLVFCAVSDTALDELLGLVRLIKEISIPDSRE